MTSFLVDELRSSSSGYRTHSNSCLKNLRWQVIGYIGGCRARRPLTYEILFISSDHSNTCSQMGFCSYLAQAHKRPAWGRLYLNRAHEWHPSTSSVLRTTDIHLVGFSPPGHIIRGAPLRSPFSRSRAEIIAFQPSQQLHLFRDISSLAIVR